MSTDNKNTEESVGSTADNGAVLSDTGGNAATTHRAEDGVPVETSKDSTDATAALLATYEGFVTATTTSDIGLDLRDTSSSFISSFAESHHGKKTTATSFI